jgi:hypothetical protein
MSKFVNTKPINLDPKNNTSEFFNNFFDQEIIIGPAQDQTISAYFERRTGNKKSAEILAGALILSSSTRGIDPLEVLEKIKSLDDIDVDAYVAFIYNLARVNTSLVGVVNRPPVSKYIVRTILG